MWDRVAAILNSIGEGVTKTGAEWSKYWVDFKAKLKRKNRLNTHARNATGGGPSTEQPLTEIERKFLSILGEDYGSGLPGVQVRPAVTEEIQSRHETDRLSQPSTSTDGNPVYLDISFDDSDHQYQSPNIIETIEEPTNQPPSPTTPGPPASAVNAPSQAGAAAGNIISIQQRRRQRRQSRITVGEARERIVSASERRAEAEAANSASLQQALTILNEMVAVLRRIERKLPGEDPRVE
ncbi:hypothetical protein ACJJTC_008309 [Scirpophaga incertulas]